MAIDLSIRSWGASNPSLYPPGWPLWTTPDIYVDNNGNRTLTTAPAPAGFRYHQNVNESGEPEKGRADNRLFAWVRNLGTTPAAGAIVSFYYCPCGMIGGQNPYPHFNLIAQVSVDLGASGTPTGEKEVEVWWDLSDLSENNGGVWPAPISAYNHFCVQVTIEHPQDTNAGNNMAQNNFFNILSSSAFAPVPILVANNESVSKKFELAAQNLPEGWELHVRGTGKEIHRLSGDSGTKFTLKPGEERSLTVTLVPKTKGRQMNHVVDIAVLTEGKPVGGISIATKKRGAVRTMKRLTFSPPYALVHAVNPKILKEG